jgi:hypothetical protein
MAAPLQMQPPIAQSSEVHQQVNPSTVPNLKKVQRPGTPALFSGPLFSGPLTVWRGLFFSIQLTD